jgi:hypothetical protein
MGMMISSCDSIPRRAAGEDRKDAALPAPNGKPSTSSPAGGRAEWQKCDSTRSYSCLPLSVNACPQRPLVDMHTPLKVKWLDYVVLDIVLIIIN